MNILELFVSIILVLCMISIGLLYVVIEDEFISHKRKLEDYHNDNK